MNALLNAVILPDEKLILEWDQTSEQSDPSVRKLQEELYELSAENHDEWLLNLALCDRRRSFSLSVDFWKDFLGLFAEKLQQTEDLEEKREELRPELTEEDVNRFLNSAPLMTGIEYLDEDLLRSVWKRLLEVFNEKLGKHSGSVESFIQSFNPQLHAAGRVYFHLVENKGDHPFAFMATYSTRLGSEGKSRHVPLKYALKEFAGDQKKLLELLQTVYKAAQTSEWVAGLIESGELFHPIALNSKEALTFLMEVAHYEASGILCRIPNWWRARTSSVKTRITVGEKPASKLGMEALLSAQPRLEIDGVEIGVDEVEALLEQSEGLTMLKNRWVAVDKEKLKEALEAYKQAQDVMAEGMTLSEALRLELSTKEKDDGIVAPEVSLGHWAASVMQSLSNPEELEKVSPDRSLKAQLRHYQQDGLNWLWALHTLGFGACLADDMGLGKTVQILAFLSVLRRKSPNAVSLLVLPASLLSNWQQEIHKFLPDLKVCGAHPSMQKGGKVKALTQDEAGKYDLVITTYALSSRRQWFKEVNWTYIILDEAQAIKNPSTRQTRSIKTLQSKNRIVMTGTPVENRLGDIWSLFDFLNPGLLGTAKQFTAFTKSLDETPANYGKLRNTVKPYILRRLKTDKKIISDLPDKVEMKTWSKLSKRQVVLYRELVFSLELALQDSEGIQRKGLVLSSLMKFKQLCNHPDQYLGQQTYNPEESGKFQRLRELCETIYEKRERVLVFTQFQELTEPLNHFLQSIFKRKGSVLHGGVPVKKRKEIVSEFQKDHYTPFMILTIKAGGVGLNLTNANHIVHFDRWWNPAIENQATDRAFRIGQTKDVLVHKFITKGTIEEKIDEMLEEKRELADKVVSSSGESWITEMDSDNLVDMFKLTL